MPPIPRVEDQVGADWTDENMEDDSTFIPREAMIRDMFQYGN